MTAPTVYFGLGSNIEPDRYLRLGVDELRRRFGELRLSPVYRSAAVGFDGDDFLNLVLACHSDLGPDELLGEIEAIHALAGRRRGEEKFSARTLDIDLLMIDDQVVDAPPVKLPRNDVLSCAFVLKPLLDLEPDLAHPETGRRLEEHWAEFDQASQPLEKIEMDFDGDCTT